MQEAAFSTARTANDQELEKVICNEIKRKIKSDSLKSESFALLNNDFLCLKKSDLRKKIANQIFIANAE